MLHFLKNSIWICTILAALPAHASDFESPRTGALGGAGHANPLLNDSIYLNPSYEAFLPTYSVSANYDWYHGGATEPDGSSELHGRTLNASIQDGQSDLFHAGVGLTLQDNGKLLNIGAAKAAIKQLGIGLGAKIFFPNQANVDGVRDMMFSSTYIILPWLNAAFIVDNLFSGSGAQAQGFYREFILGTKINVQGIVFIYLDPHLAPDVPNQSAVGQESGVEFQVLQDLFLRLGLFHNSKVPYLDNTVRGRGYGAGIGWLAPKISLDYGIQRVVDPVSTVTQLVGMTIYL